LNGGGVCHQIFRAAPIIELLELHSKKVLLDQCILLSYHLLEFLAQIVYRVHSEVQYLPLSPREELFLLLGVALLLLPTTDTTNKNYWFRGGGVSDRYRWRLR
jgi:hypothetical protein